MMAPPANTESPNVIRVEGWVRDGRFVYWCQRCREWRGHGWTPDNPYRTPNCPHRALGDMVEMISLGEPDTKVAACIDADEPPPDQWRPLKGFGNTVLPPPWERTPGRMLGDEDFVGMVRAEVEHVATDLKSDHPSSASAIEHVLEALDVVGARLNLPGVINDLLVPSIREDHAKPIRLKRVALIDASPGSCGVRRAEPMNRQDHMTGRDLIASIYDGEIRPLLDALQTAVVHWEKVERLLRIAYIRLKAWRAVAIDGKCASRGAFNGLIGELFHGSNQHGYGEPATVST